MPKRLIQGGALSAVAIVCALAVSASSVGAQGGAADWLGESRHRQSGGRRQRARVVGHVDDRRQRRQYLGHLRRVPFCVSAGDWRRRHPRPAREPRGRRRLVEGRRDDPRVAGRQRAQRVHDASRRAAACVSARSKTGGSTTRADRSRWGPRRCGCVWSGRATSSLVICPRTGRPGRRSGTATISMTPSVYVGLAVSSRVDSTLATATFTNRPGQRTWLWHDAPRSAGAVDQS